MEELKPCPFCGQQPTWTHSSERSFGWEDGVQRVYKWQSSLHCCIVHTSGFGDVKWDGGNGLAHQRAMRDAAATWNRRG